MTQDINSDSQDNIRMDGTSREQSNVNQIGKLQANNVFIGTEKLEKLEALIERLNQSNSANSVGILKAGNPHKSLAYWQGREEEIKQLHQWLGDKNITLIGIEGIGGTGKSTLAAKIYEEEILLPDFSKRFWADVSTGANFSNLARQVLTAFGYGVPEKELQLVDALVKCLQSGQYLLVIDNLETLVQQNRQWRSSFYEDFFRDWLEFGSRSTVLVTTRERPEFKGFKWLSLKGLEPKEGADLLAELDIQGELESFSELVDGHPLLLRLVADLLKEEYPQNPSLERLGDLGLGNLRELLTDARVVGQHRREDVGMVLVLDASFEWLSNWQKQLLLNVSVYRGAFEAKMAGAFDLSQPLYNQDEEKKPAPQPGEDEIEQELRKLAKRSWLNLQSNGKRQFEFQPVVLEYIRYKAGDSTAAHLQAIDYYRSIDIGATEQFWEIKAEVRAYLEIFYHACQLEDYDLAFETLQSCNKFLNLRGYYTDIVELYGQLVAAWELNAHKSNWKYTASLTSLGNAYDSLGQYQQAIQYHQQSLDITREIGDKQGEASSYNNLGNAYNSLGQYQQAIQYHQQSLDIKREIGDKQGEAYSYIGLGNAYNSLGQYQQAIQYHQQSLDITREIGDKKGEANSYNNLGNAYDSLGQYQQAIQYHQQSLDITREIGDKQGEASSYNNLGNAYNSLGQYQQAIQYYQQSLDITREIGDKQGEAYSYNNLGNAYNSLGQYQQAIQYHQQSLDITREIGDKQGEAYSYNNLGNAYNSLGQYQQAIQYHQQSLDITREIGDKQGEANSYNNLGNAYNSLGQYQQAIQYYQQSLDITREIGDKQGEANSYIGLGNAYNSLGQYQQAIQYYQQSLDIKREIGDKQGEAYSYIGLGNAYNSLGQYQQAIQYHQQSLDIKREIGDKQGEANSYNNLGNAYNSLGQYQQAIQFYQQSLDIKREIGDKQGKLTLT